MKHGKKYLESAKLIESSKLYDPDEAVKLALQTAKTKFDETMEISVRLGVDPRQADQQVRGAVVLPHGTGYITDAGMTGVVDSVIGADKEIAVERFLTNLRIPFSLAEGECALCGVILDADERTGRCRSIRRIRA